MQQDGGMLRKGERLDSVGNFLDLRHRLRESEAAIGLWTHRRCEHREQEALVAIRAPVGAPRFHELHRLLHKHAVKPSPRPRGLENIEEKAPERGIEIHQADEDLLAKSREWIAADLDALAASYEERFGIENAKGKLEDLRKLVDEWMPRMEGIDDREALAEVLWENVYSKLDLKTYGM